MLFVRYLLLGAGVAMFAIAAGIPPRDEYRSHVGESREPGRGYG